jgi:hypothetical protein
MESLKKYGIHFSSQVNSLIKPDEPIFTFAPFPNG